MKNTIKLENMKNTIKSLIACHLFLLYFGYSSIGYYCSLVTYYTIVYSAKLIFISTLIIK